MERKNYKLLEQIVRNKIPCLFISPHFDDAALSCGGLISYLSDKTELVVVNVFTEGGEPPYTFSTKVFLGRCGYKDAKKLFDQRKLEDAESFKNLKVDIINLGFVDALWRKRKDINSLTLFLSKIVPELIHVYKTFRFHVKVGKVSINDQELILQIKSMLNNLIKGKDVYVFCPLAIGSHVDHIIIRNICNQLKTNTIFWSDYPYNLENNKFNGFLDRYKFKTFVFNKNQDERIKLIRGYKSQIYGLFPDGNINLLPESYFFKKIN